jgi:hypothetical protein
MTPAQAHQVKSLGVISANLCEELAKRPVTQLPFKGADLI